MYCWTDLNIPDSEALQILKVASLTSRLDKPDGSHAIVNGNSLFDIYDVSNFVGN